MLCKPAPAAFTAPRAIQFTILAGLAISVALAGAFAQSQPPAGQGRTIAAGERVRISIVGLMGEGVESRLTRRVESGGALRLPKLDTSRIDATALTAAELESAIARLYEQQTTLAVKLVVVSRLDADEDHALDVRGGILQAAPATPLIVRGAPQPWPEALTRMMRDPFAVSEVPLNDVLQLLASLLEIPVSVDWMGLELDGIDRETEITVEFNAPVSLGRVLRSVLDQASPFSEVEYEWIDGVLVITTADRLVRYKDTMVVDIRPLAPPDASRAAAVVDEAVVEEIIDMITTSVATDAWDRNGGALGTIRLHKGELVVTGSPSVLRQTLDLLQKLTP